MAARTGTNAFECKICTEGYDSEFRKPVSLPCGHTFCYSCVVCVGSRGGKNCPDCRRLITQPVDELPVIFALIEPPERPAPRRDNFPSTRKCQTHDSGLEYLCADCSEILCRKCSRQSHQRHCVEYALDVVNKDDVARQFTQELQSKIEAKVKHLDDVLNTSGAVSGLAASMMASTQEIKQCQNELASTKTSLVEDLNAWEDAQSKSDEDKMELFERLCKAWKEKDVLVHDEETLSNFLSEINALVASARRMEELGEGMRSLVQQNIASSSDPRVFKFTPRTKRLILPPPPRRRLPPSVRKARNIGFTSTM